MRKRFLNFWSILAVSLMLVLGGGVGYAHLATSHDALAGAMVVGDPHGATDRLLFAPQSGKVQRIVYFAAGARTMTGANTPVVGQTVCGVGGSLYRADVELVGTMSGTAPTLAVLWQNSIDGTNWKNVGTWTTINATVTPASQSQVVSDIVGSTAVAYGDCWRATLTFGGSGTVTANVSVKGVAK
jgi:hypothetical protein